jgi:hypothetical protein
LAGQSSGDAISRAEITSISRRRGQISSQVISRLVSIIVAFITAAAIFSCHFISLIYAEPLILISLFSSFISALAID